MLELQGCGGSDQGRGQKRQRQGEQAVQAQLIALGGEASLAGRADQARQVPEGHALGRAGALEQGLRDGGDGAAVKPNATAKLWSGSLT